MKNRYRIQNYRGQVLCHVDTAQQAGDVICNLGTSLCQTQYVEDLKGESAYPFTTFKPDITGFMGTQHKTREEAISQLKGQS